LVYVPETHFDTFLWQLGEHAGHPEWLGAYGRHYISIRKHLPDIFQESSERLPIDSDQPTEIDSAATIHAPSLTVLLTLFRQRLDLDRLDWRQLECIVAELLEAEGYDVELGKGSKDGGADIIAYRDIPMIGPVRTVWQSKHLKSGNKVGLSVIRELADVRNEFNATKGIIVTSSFLTGGALKRINRDKFTLGKIERPELESWIQATLGRT
jgi:Restriction endonuclease